MLKHERVKTRIFQMEVHHSNNTLRPAKVCSCYRPKVKVHLMLTMVHSMNFSIKVLQKQHHWKVTFQHFNIPTRYQCKELNRTADGVYISFSVATDLLLEQFKGIFLPLFVYLHKRDAWNPILKIPPTGDKESLDRCGQQDRYNFGEVA